MKIGLVILHADPARGGAERYTVDLADALRERGHDVALVASSFGNRPVPAGGVHVESRSATRRGQYLRFLDGLDAHLDSARYDIVHAMLPVRRCDVYHPHAGLAAQAVRPDPKKYPGLMRQGAARLVNRWNLRREEMGRVERALLTGANPPIVLSLSNYIQREVGKHYQLPPDRLATLFNAVDQRRFDPDSPGQDVELRTRLGIQPDRVIALMIAQDFARKGLREAIAAMAIAGNEGITLVVVGGDDSAPYRRFAQERGVADHVIWAGKTEDPASYYRLADFFVLPTRHDPCSLVVLEALAMGVPVISTVHNGACEIMQDGVHGFVLPDPSDIDWLGGAMRAMLDPNTRARMRLSCRSLRPALAYPRHLDRLLSIYATVRPITG